MFRSTKDAFCYLTPNEHCLFQLTVVLQVILQNTFCSLPSSGEQSQRKTVYFSPHEWNWVSSDFCLFLLLQLPPWNFSLFTTLSYDTMSNNPP